MTQTRRPNITNLLLSIWILFLQINCGRTQRYLSPIRKAEQDTLNFILSDDYDPRINPGGNDTARRPTLITVGMEVRSFEVVKDGLTLHCTLKSRWDDSRLFFSPPKNFQSLNYLSLTDSSGIWTPKIYFAHAKTVTGASAKNGGCGKHDDDGEYVQIFSNGTLLHSQRLTLIMPCRPMNVEKIFDQKICTIQLQSFGSSSSTDLILKWSPNDALQLLMDFETPPQLKLIEYTATAPCDSHRSDEAFTCLKAQFHFSVNNLNRYSIFLLVTTMLLVTLGWLSFWLDSTIHLMARMVLAVSSLSLLIIIMVTRSKLDSCSLLTNPLDLWTVVCLFYSFFVVIETILVSHWTHSSPSNNIDPNLLLRGQNYGDVEQAKLIRQNGGSKNDDSLTEKVNEQEENGDIIAIQENLMKERGPKSFLAFNRKKLDEKIDLISKIFYPLTFILFVIIYFIGQK